MSIVTLAIAAAAIVLGVASGDAQITLAAVCGACGIATLVGTSAPVPETSRSAPRRLTRPRVIAGKTHS